jgi:hypothetical protein
MIWHTTRQDMIWATHHILNMRFYLTRILKLICVLIAQRFVVGKDIALFNAQFLKKPIRCRYLCFTENRGLGDRH